MILTIQHGKEDVDDPGLLSLAYSPQARAVQRNHRKYFPFSSLRQTPTPNCRETKVKVGLVDEYLGVGA